MREAAGGWKVGTEQESTHPAYKRSRRLAKTCLQARGLLVSGPPFDFLHCIPAYLEQHKSTR